MTVVGEKRVWRKTITQQPLYNAKILLSKRLPDALQRVGVLTEKEVDGGSTAETGLNVGVLERNGVLTGRIHEMTTRRNLLYKLAMLCKRTGELITGRVNAG